MSLIKDTLPIDEDFKNLSNRPAFKSPIQMLVASNKKSVVFPINELEKPTIDSVLNTVPLFYNPITKQLILQQDLEQHKLNQHHLSVRKCDSRLNEDNQHHKTHSKPVELTTADKVKKLNNLNQLHNLKSAEIKNEIVVKEERKFLETQLDDFTTKILDKSESNLSQRPVEIKRLDEQKCNLLINQNKLVNNFKINSSTSPLNDLNLDKLILNNKSDKLDSIKVNLNSTQVNSNEKEDKLSNKQQQTSQSIKKETKKDTFKTHRRTPSYIHNFHDVIKNSNQTHQNKLITVSSVSHAIQTLTKTSLANATSTLSNTLSTTNAKLNQMNSTTTSTNPQLDQALDFSSTKPTKQIIFNEAKNELNFYDLDIDSEIDSAFMNKKYDDIEPLDLPSPYLDKPKKLSLITSPIQSVLSKFTSSSKSSSIKHHHQSATENNANNNDKSKKRNSKNFDNDLIANSTTGLIFENRPSNLPTKSPDEELNHRTQYEQLIKDVKRKELKDVKQIKKNLIKKKKDEERMLNSIKVWQNEVIPKFEELRNTKKVKELWNNGLPSNLRSTIWNLAIGNQLNLDEKSFENYLAKWYDSSLDHIDENKLKNNDRIVNCLSKSSDEIELIKLDVSRTFPTLKLFQKGAPFYDTLLKLAGTWCIAYRSDIGYIQGMSFILGMFLLNMDSKLAFNAFANLLNSSPLLMTFMKVDQKGMQSFYQTFDVYFSLNLPELYNHFKEQKLNTELFMIDWIYTLFTKVLPLDISTRVWDLMFRDGCEEMIIKTSLTILKLFEKQLLLNDFINCAQFLTTQLSIQSNNFPVDCSKFFSTLNSLNLKPITMNKKKCNFYTLYQHFNSTKIHSS